MPKPDDLPNPLVSGLHFRGQLPHLKKEGAVDFVTFRLDDSLPAHEVVRLKHEREVIIEQAAPAGVRSPGTRSNSCSRGIATKSRRCSTLDTAPVG